MGTRYNVKYHIETVSSLGGKHIFYGSSLLLNGTFEI